VETYLQIILPHSKVEALTDTVAMSAMASPLWLPWLKDVSEISGILLPTAGLIWIIVQIVVKILVTRKSLRDEDKK